MWVKEMRCKIWKTEFLFWGEGGGGGGGGLLVHCDSRHTGNVFWLRSAETTVYDCNNT